MVLDNNPTNQNPGQSRAYEDGEMQCQACNTGMPVNRERIRTRAILKGVALNKQRQQSIMETGLVARSRFGWRLLLLLLALLVSVSHDLGAGESDEINALRLEVEALKRSQQQLQKDIKELKRQLQRTTIGLPAQPAFKPSEILVGDSPMLGATDAPVTLFEFSDYDCPFCARHATATTPELIKQYVDSGKLRIVMREFPMESLDSPSFAAAMAASCAGAQGQYWAMHNLLFANQGSLSDDNLQAYADTLGLDARAYANCIANPATADGINASKEEATSLGIYGAPSFVAGLTDAGNPDKVHGTRFIRGARHITAFQNVIDSLLTEADGARSGKAN